MQRQGHRVSLYNEQRGQCRLEVLVDPWFASAGRDLRRIQTNACHSHSSHVRRRSLDLSGTIEIGGVTIHRIGSQLDAMHSDKTARDRAAGFVRGIFGNEFGAVDADSGI
jgi:hypothetical protein